MNNETRDQAWGGTRKGYGPGKPNGTPEPRAHRRFDQLLALADHGDECAIADLWREFGFAFHRREP